MDNSVGEFVVAGHSGFNPFPSEASLLNWAKGKLLMLEAKPGTYRVLSDLTSGELILLPRKEARRQERDGGNFISLASIYVVTRAHAELLERLRSQGEPPANSSEDS